MSDQSQGKSRRAAATAPKERIHGRIAEELGIAIVTGVHAPGATMPNEVEASERLGVSRAAYREALRILTAKGLVRSRPKTGTLVNARSAWNLLDPDVLAWMFKGHPSLSFIQDLFELRSIIEPAAAALAAQRRTAAQISRMGHALEQMEANGLESPAGRTADENFHSEILRAAGNEALAALIDTTTSAVRWSVIHKQQTQRKLRDAIPEHRAVYAAIIEGNPDAARSASLTLLAHALEDSKQSVETPA